MRGTIARGLGLSLMAACLCSCGLDTQDEAPYLDPPTELGMCGSTADLFPRLQSFIGRGDYEPLRLLVQDRLQPTPENPAPDPSWRSVVKALLALIEQLGLEQAALVATIVGDGEVEDQLGPLLLVVLQFLDGQLDGVDHYDAADAAAFFVDRCDASYLLASVEGVLRLDSPSTNKPWLVALLDGLAPLLNNPTLRPFLTSFEEGGEEGRPAIVNVLRQIMAFLADEDFEISRVHTLLQSVVYPLADQSLERDIEALMVLFEEVTDPELDVYLPLQQAMRCGMRFGEPRDELLGVVYDLLVSPEVGLDKVLEGVEVVRLDVIVSQLELLADVVEVLRDDKEVQDELRAVLILFLSRPAVQDVVPVLIGLIEQEVVGELLEAVVVLLQGCGRDVAS